MNSLELFTGAGGLAIGTSLAGFKHLDLVERDKYCCSTINANIRHGSEITRFWPETRPRDVTKECFEGFASKVDLLAGGPPCQPFSLGGKHKAQNDARDMFPYLAKAVRVVRPKIVLIENVKGLARKSYEPYLEYIKNQIRYPDLERSEKEDMASHLTRLARHHTAKSEEEEYHVVAACLNSADYGVPQKRERVFIIGIRTDLRLGWSFADVGQTHSQNRLLWDQWVTGDYWKKHNLQRPSEKPPRLRARIASLEKLGTEPSEKAWRTTRDAISDLPDPRSTEASSWLSHQYQAGARSYPGHTGSPLDEPSKTIKAGVHGVPGGENMLRHPNGKVRYFTVRETARIQCFPDNYIFEGSWTETMRQLGNAVPTLLGKVVASSLASRLSV